MNNKAAYGLTYELTKRDIQSRYRGSWLGVFWSILNPVLLLVIYSFVFGVIFRARWPALEGQGVANYSVLLFCGLVTHMFMADVLTRSPQVIVQNANYVKKVVFPLQIFSGVTVFSSAFHFILSFIIVVCFAAYKGHIPGVSLLLFPLLLLQFILLTMGVSWILSALGVYFRDITYIAGFLATALMFLSPIFYPSSAVPESFQAVMLLNPLTFYVEAFRDIAIFSRVPNLQAWGIALIVALAVFVLGKMVFSRAKSGFADVL